jgi:hypothetical protein
VRNKVDEFDSMSINAAENAINIRTKDLLTLNEELRRKDLVYYTYKKLIQAKKQELKKRKEEMEVTEKVYMQKYQVILDKVGISLSH